MNKDIKHNILEIIGLRNLLMIFTLATCHYLVAKFALYFNPPGFNIGLFWPAVGLSAFFALQYGLKVLPGVFIAQLILLIDLNYMDLDWQHTQQIISLVSQALNVCFLIFLTRFVVLRFTYYQGNILDKTSLPRLLLFVGPMSAFVPMLISIFLLKDTGLILEQGIVYSGWVWWVGDSFGIAICLPVLLFLFNKNKVSSIQKLVVLGTSCLLLLATLAIFKYAEHEKSQIFEKVLEQKGRDIAGQINSEIQHFMKSARYLNTYLAEDGAISLTEFNQCSHHLLNVNQSLKSLAWGVGVEDKQRQQFEKSLQQLYDNEYSIKELNLSSGEKIAALKNHYYPVKFVYPYAENRADLGGDYTVGQGDLNDLLIAIENGEDTLSYFVDSSGRNKVIKLYTPFYSIDRQFVGYLRQVIDIKYFFSEMLDSSMYQNIQIEIQEISEKLPITVYKKDHNEDYAIRASYQFQLLNKTWSVNIGSNQSFYSENKLSASWFILLAGLMVTLFMNMVLLLLIRKQQQLQYHVDQKKEILEESLSHQSLLSATFNTHQAIVITDPEYNIIRVNNAFCNVTGYTEMEVVGENPRILSSGRQSEGFYKNMWGKLLSSGRYEGEVWNRRKNGEIFPEYQTISEIRNAQGEILYYISVFSDITKLKQEEEKIRHQAFYDQLTLLPNKMLFLDRLDQEIAYARRFDGVGALLLIDIDDFKVINDSLGHHFGDDVLIEFSRRLGLILRDTDTVAHLGGDDFIVFMPVEKRSEQDVQQHVTLVAEKILEIIKPPFAVKNEDYQLTASLGISFIQNNQCTAADILRQAEQALYKVKMAGKRSFAIFQDET